MSDQTVSHLLTAMACAALTAIAACGGGGSSDGTAALPGDATPPSSAAPPATAPPAAAPITISGVAASGAGFAGAEVSVIDSKGDTVGRSAPLGSDGVYQVTLDEGATPPFILFATRTSPSGETQTLVSVAESAEVTTANLTPITTLIASRLSKSGDPTKLADELKAGEVQVGADEVAATVEDVKAILGPLLAASSTAGFNPLRDDFSTDGTGHDQLLDSITVSIVPAGSSANVEVAVKPAREDDEPAAIRFTSDQPATAVIADNGITDTAIGATTVDASSLAAPGFAVQVASLMQRLTTCYAVPFEQRVSGAEPGVNFVAGGAADVLAPSCRSLFVGDDPAVFRHNGAVVQRTVANTGAFASLFRRPSTGAVFSDGTYESAEGDDTYTVGYRTRDTQGAESTGTLVVQAGEDGVLRIIGNQYAFGGGVAAYHQKRTFITLDQDPYSYLSTGYTIQVPNIWSGDHAVLRKVVVTTPSGKVMTVWSGPPGQSQLVFYREGGQNTGTNFIRLRSEYVDGSTERLHPMEIDTARPFYSAVEWTEAELVAASTSGRWKFEYFLWDNNDASAVPDAVQYFRTRARALSIAELRAKGFAELTPEFLAEVRSGAQPADQPAAGTLVLEDGEEALIGTGEDGDGWTVLPGQMAPTSVTLFGRYGDAAFNDGATVAASARSVIVPCPSSGAGAAHCSAAHPGTYAEGAVLTGLQLWSTDSQGREYANFNAMYSLGLAD